MEEQKNDQNKGQPFLNQLKIRTMQDDLKAAGGQKPLPSAVPVPTAPTKESYMPAPSAIAKVSVAEPKKELSVIPPKPMPAKVYEPPAHLPTESAVAAPKVFAPKPEVVAPAPPPPLPPPPLPKPQIQPLEKLPFEKPLAPVFQITPESIKETPSSVKTPVWSPPPTPLEPVVPVVSKPGLFAGLFAKPVFKLSLIIGGVIIVIGGGLVYLFWPKEIPICQEGKISEECQCGQELKTDGFCCNNFWLDEDCSVTKLPESIIPSAGQIITVNTKDASLDNIISDIKDAGQTSLKENLELIALKTDINPDRYATFDEFLSVFGINLPPQIKSNTQAYNLFLYVKPAEATSTASNGTSTPESEARLVLVLKQNSQISTSAKETMLTWENTITDDIKPLVFNQLDEATTQDFQETQYNNGVFRYKNFPDSSTTIDYVSYKDLLIISTSKNSAFYSFDAANSQY